MGDLLLTLFLVFLNGFFVAAEFAIVKVRSSQLEVRSVVNRRLAAAAKSIIANLDSYLAATQLGITLASLGLGWVGEDVMSKLIIRAFGLFNLNFSEQTAHSLALPLAFVVITVLHIIFGELAPKSLAIQFPTSTTFVVAWPMKVFYFIFRPFIWLLNGIANLLLRAIGIRPIHGNDIHTEEELRMIITESQEGGAIEETERELIQNVFDFDDRRVWDIQTLKKNITAIPKDMSIEDAIRFTIQEGYSRYPVYDKSIDEIIGIIYTKDLMKTMVNPIPGAQIAPLVREPYFIGENKLIKDLLRELQSKRIQIAIVTNEIGEVTGIVTMEDILEELVGEIQDEYDNEKPLVETTATGSFIVSAHEKLAEINKYLPIPFDEEAHFETLAGYIADEHQEELKVNDRLELNGYEVIVLKMYRNSVERVELRVLESGQ